MATINVDQWNLVFPGNNARVSIRNGIPTHAAGPAALASQINFLLGYRKRRLFTKSIRPADALAVFTTDRITWAGRSYISPNATTVRCRMVLAAAEEGHNSGGPQFYWETKNVDTGATTNQATHVWSSLVPAGTGRNPEDLAVVTQDWNLTPRDTYEFGLHVASGCRPVGCSIYEVPRLTLDTASDLYMDPRPFAARLPIHDPWILNLLLRTETAWQELGAQHIAWCVNQDAPITRTSTSGANLMDQTVTAWAASSPGWKAYVKNRGSHDSNNVAAVFAARAKVSAGTGTIELHKDTSGTPIASLSITGTTTAWVSTTVNLDAGQTSEKYDILIKGPGGADTLSVYAASLYDLGI